MISVQSSQGARRSRLVRPSAEAVQSGSRHAGLLEQHAQSVVGAPTVAAGAAAVAGTLVTRPLRLVYSGGRFRLSNGAFVLLILSLLSLILMSLLLLNTVLGQNSFELNRIRVEERELMIQEQVLAARLAEVESPVGLQEVARDSGLVAASNPVFLDLDGAQVLGEPMRAEAPPQEKKKKKKKDKPPVETNGASPGPSAGGGFVRETDGASPAVPAAPVRPSDVPASGGAFVRGGQ